MSRDGLSGKPGSWDPMPASFAPEIEPCEECGSLRSQLSALTALVDKQGRALERCRDYVKSSIVSHFEGIGKGYLAKEFLEHSEILKTLNALLANPAADDGAKDGEGGE